MLCRILGIKCAFENEDQGLVFLLFNDHYFLGITFANGEVWKEHRQFAVKNLKHVGYGKTLMEKEIQNELSSLLKQIKENNDKPINIVNLLSESVINVLWKFVAGKTYIIYCVLMYSLCHLEKTKHKNHK